MIKNIDDLIEHIEKNDGFKFQIKVIANSKVNSIEFLDGTIKLKIIQRAIEGKANKAIIEYLSKVLKKPKTKISILKGEKCSVKLIGIEK